MKKLLVLLILCLLFLTSCGDEPEITVATVNGEAITESEVTLLMSVNTVLSEFYGAPEEFPTGREAVIYHIAGRMAIEQAAEAAGISFSDAEIRALIAEEDAYMRRRAAEKDEAMVKKESDDAVLLTRLGMTREEYNEKVYFEMLKASEIYSEYAAYFFGENGYDIDAYEAHVAAVISAAEVVILPEAAN